MDLELINCFEKLHNEKLENFVSESLIFGKINEFLKFCEPVSTQLSVRRPFPWPIFQRMGWYLTSSCHACDYFSCISMLFCACLATHNKYCKHDKSSSIINACTQSVKCNERRTY